MPDARIERLYPALNAIITPLFDKARAQAVSPNLPVGPFQGVPMLLKDYLCHTAGDPYFEDMRFLRDLGWSEERDTYLAARGILEIDHPAEPPLVHEHVLRTKVAVRLFFADDHRVLCGRPSCADPE